jgi:hypothetical protein
VLVGSDVTFEGTRSGDELIFNYFDNEEWVLFFDSYIDPNTKIQEYNGDVTAIYTLK